MNHLSLDSESSIRLTIFILVFVFLAIAELIWPRRVPAPGKMRRWFANIALSLINTLVVRMAIPLAGVASAILASERGWGILNTLDTPDSASIFMFILAFDFTIYWQHRIYHFVPLLWRFHRVHHTDEDYDLTTGNRFHPVSIVLSALIKIGLVFIMGPPAVAVVIGEVLLNATSMFNHSNIRIPAMADSWLRRILVTPDMHRVHHSTDLTEHNRNFGFNFSWWDRLFGTYLNQPSNPHQNMAIGINGINGKQTAELPSLLIQPRLRIVE